MKSFFFIFTFMNKLEIKDLLFDLISENKKTLFEKNGVERTRHMTLVLENIFQPHNASAVIRSCDCFGIQDVHIIENHNRFEVSKDIALGSNKWLNIYNYNKKENNTADCLNHLKNKGYRIIATTPHINDSTIDKLPIDKPFALVFGTELTGLSDKALKWQMISLKYQCMGSPKVLIFL